VFFYEDFHMNQTEKQSFYLSRIQSAEQNKLSIREVVQQNNIGAQSVYAAVEALHQKGGLSTTKTSQDFVKLPVPPLTHDLRFGLKKQLPNG